MLWPFDVLNSGDWEFSKYLDDHFNFIDYPALNSLLPWSWTHWREIVMHNGINVFEPVANLFKALVIDVVGLDSRKLRLISFSIHTLNAIFLGVWLGLLLSPGQERKRSSWRHCLIAFGCMLWWLHPMCVEAVGWISAFGYPLALLQCLLSCICVELALKNKARTPWAELTAALLLYVTSCLSKAPSIVLAVVHIFRLAVDPSPKQPALTKLWFPVLLVLTGAVMSRTVFQANEQNISHYLAPRTTHAVLHSLIRAAFTVACFAFRAVWPFDLRVHYQVPPLLRVAGYETSPNPWSLIVDSNEISASISLLALTTLAILCTSCQNRSRPALVMGWVSFLIFWAPGGGVIPHGWVTLGGDRYGYMPNAFGTATLVAVLLDVFESTEAATPTSSLPQQISHFKHLIRPLALFLLAAHVLILGRESRALLLHWRSDKFLFENCIVRDPLDAECHLNLAEYYGSWDKNEVLSRHHRHEALRVLPLLDVKDHLLRGKVLLFMQEHEQCCIAVKEGFAVSERAGYWKWTMTGLQQNSTIVKAGSKMVPSLHLAMLLNNLLVCEAVNNGVLITPSPETAVLAGSRVKLLQQLLPRLETDDGIVARLEEHLERYIRLEKGEPIEGFSANFYW